MLHTALPQAAHAANYYWDTDSITAGFGTAGGTWGSSANWSTDDSGLLSTTAYTTTTSDGINFGAGVTGLGAGTVAVTGTQSAGALTFASGSGAIVLSNSGGATINLAAASTITVNNATDTISTPLTGAGTSLSKAGVGKLTLSGANSYTGATTVNAGQLAVSGSGTLATTGLTVTNGGSFYYLPTTVGTTLTLGTGSTLNLNDGSALGLAWNTTTANKITALGAGPSVQTGGPAFLSFFVPHLYPVFLLPSELPLLHFTKYKTNISRPTNDFSPLITRKTKNQ